MMFPKFTSCSFSDKAASWLPFPHLCTKREGSTAFLGGKFVGVVIINALAFLSRLRRWPFCGFHSLAFLVTEGNVQCHL